MKQLPLILIAVLSIGVGIWFGLHTGEQGNSGGYGQLGGPFTLQSEKGPVSLSDFRGKVVPVYFGYTRCPDVCITSLNKMRAALKLLTEKERAQVQPIFISVDPERDTPKVVGEYARYFDPSIIGLTGSQDAIADVAKRYMVIYQKVPLENSAMGYSIDHSSIIYVIGRDGKVDSLVHHAESADALAKALRKALG
jgi:protein SCO1/2